MNFNIISYLGTESIVIAACSFVVASVKDIWEGEIPVKANGLIRSSHQLRFNSIWADLVRHLTLGGSFAILILYLFALGCAVISHPAIHIMNKNGAVAVCKAFNLFLVIFSISILNIYIWARVCEKR